MSGAQDRGGQPRSRRGASLHARTGDRPRQAGPRSTSICDTTRIQAPGKVAVQIAEGHALQLVTAEIEADRSETRAASVSSPTALDRRTHHRVHGSAPLADQCELAYRQVSREELAAVSGSDRRARVTNLSWQPGSRLSETQARHSRRIGTGFAAFVMFGVSASASDEHPHRSSQSDVTAPNLVGHTRAPRCGRNH